MRHDAIAIDRALALALDDDALLGELGLVFAESAARHALALSLAQDAESWRDAAWRLKGCAASFGAGDLMAAADLAATAKPADAPALAAVARAIGALAG